MQNRDSRADVLKRGVVISPNSRMVRELAPLLESHLAGSSINFVNSYPSPRDVGSALGGGSLQLVFLDVASDPERGLQLLSEMVRLGSHVHVLALLSGNDPDFILRCLRAGAAEFLLEPFTGEQLDAALTKIARLQPAAETSGTEPTKIIAVMPAKGACGATTIACNLAFYWKRMGAQRVLLADLDPLTGTLSFLLKIKSVYSFLDTLQRAHELDSDLWRAMVTTVNGVDILLAPELITENPPELNDPSPILEYAKSAYDVIILDAGNVYGDWNLNQARAAQEVLLVTTNELPALQAAQRALSYLDANRVGRWKIRLLVNRYQRDIGLSREVIGTALHTEVFDSIPSDYESVQKALMEGKPVPSNTPFGKSLTQVVERLGVRPGSESSKKSSSLGGLFGLFSKTSK
ncbi:MAG: response regulator [Bryobacterales bacterium]|jgi:pilus assembly protein CpaE|nr:response regulator [Bryobacterales bacterium]